MCTFSFWTRIKDNLTSASFSQSPRSNRLWTQWENNEGIAAYVQKAKWRFGTTETFPMQNIWQWVQGQMGKMRFMPINKLPSQFRASCLMTALRQETIKRACLVSTAPPSNLADCVNWHRPPLPEAYLVLYTIIVWSMSLWLQIKHCPISRLIKAFIFFQCFSFLNKSSYSINDNLITAIS